MKKLLFIISLMCGLLTLSSKYHGNYIQITKSHIFQQQQTLRAYRMAGGQWQQGTVSYQRTQYGYKPISYDFSNYQGGTRNRFFPDARFIPLNPNNKLAIQNNWTHIIGSNAGTLYMTLY